jgi:hypothetical protein
MPKSKTPAAMNVQPVSHGSTIATQSLPTMPGAGSNVTTSRRNKRVQTQRDVREARLRERVRLDALAKQRKAMKG